MCLLAVLAWTASAKGQPADPSQRERARLETLVETGDRAELLRIADDRLEAGDGPGSVEALERYVASSPPEEEGLDEVRRRIEEIERMPSTLELRTSPAGAEVRLDGEVVGSTPLSIELAAGEHRFEITAPGHDPLEAVVVLPFASRQVRRFELSLAAPIEEPLVLEEEAPVEGPVATGSGTPAIWALTGVAIGATLLGTVFGFKALSEESDFRVNPTAAGADRGERYALVADLSFGVAAGAAVTALILWLLPRDEPSIGDEVAGARFRLTGAPQGTGLGAQIEF